MTSLDHDPVDWISAAIELLKRLDAIHDQLCRIADSLEAIEEKVAS